MTTGREFRRPKLEAAIGTGLAFESESIGGDIGEGVDTTRFVAGATDVTGKANETIAGAVEGTDVGAGAGTVEGIVEDCFKGAATGAESGVVASGVVNLVRGTCTGSETGTISDAVAIEVTGPAT